MKRTAVITERVGDVTTFAGPESNRGSPGVGVGASVMDILRDLVARETPDRNLSIVPEHSFDAAAGSIERRTSGSLEIGNGAATVVTVRTRAVEAKGVSEVTLWLGAVLVLVQSRGAGI